MIGHPFNGNQLFFFLTLSALGQKGRETFTKEGDIPAIVFNPILFFPHNLV